MSSLRGRTRDASWQWFLIGFVLASGCASVLCLGAYALNLIRLPSQEAQAPTLPALTVPPPVTVVTAVTQIVITGQSPVSDNNPTITPQRLTPVTSGAVTSASEAVTAAAPVTTPSSASPVINTPGAGAGLVPATLPPVAPEQFTTPTDLLPITGGRFRMGTTQDEVIKSLGIYYNCDGTDKDKCQSLINYASDSTFPYDVVLDSFQLEKYEVTNKQYIAFLNMVGPKSHLTGCDGNPCALIKDKSTPASYITFDGTKYDIATPLYSRRPVALVTWYGANSYCRALGRRLPTEAEWEFAARGPSGNLYPWGSDWNPSGTKANTLKNVPTPIGGGGPNMIDGDPSDKTASGVFDLAGNVAEWVNDWYSADYYKSFNGTIAKNPPGPTSGDKGTRVVRGGDYANIPFYARAVQRRDDDPLSASPTVGFRCAADAAIGPAPKSGGNSSQPQPASATPASSEPLATLSAGS
ncbi:MAG TPA: SUMF1/EgtB/PvdO family nonheme iron enzyme [Aggregatilineales bacterium]|nr:SUMF1/EgtB/PvdO family nonheme iron enzyme [Aggregatilineales bacterium]